MVLPLGPGTLGVLPSQTRATSARLRGVLSVQRLSRPGTDERDGEDGRPGGVAGTELVRSLGRDREEEEINMIRLVLPNPHCCTSRRSDVFTRSVVPTPERGGLLPLKVRLIFWRVIVSNIYTHELD